MRYIAVILLFLLLGACSGKRTRPYTIKVVVLGKMKEHNMRAAIAQFKSYLPGKQVIVDTVFLDMPPEAYYKPRNRYRADSLLEFLKSRRDDHDVLMAITDVPISTTAHGHDDYGICGLSFRGKDVSVTSSYHLDKEMFLQTIRHEWGHASLNIPHCKHHNCIMNAANGKAENLRGHSRYEEKCNEKYNSFLTALL